MHDDLWFGVALKVHYADLFLQEMSRSLQPPEWVPEQAGVVRVDEFGPGGSLDAPLPNCIKHKVRGFKAARAGPYPLPYLYGHFALVAWPRLGATRCRKA